MEGRKAPPGRSGPPMAWAGAVLHFLGARFASPRLESDYRDFRISRYFLNNDAFQSTVRVLLVLSFALREVRRNGAKASTAGTLLFLFGPMAHLVLRLTADAPGRLGHAQLVGYHRTRTAVAVIANAVLEPIAVALFYSEWFKPPEEGADGLQIGFYIFIGSGALLPFYSAVSFPVMLEHNLLVQPLAAYLIGFRRESSFCLEAIASPGVAKFTLWSWHKLDGLSGMLISAMYMRDLGREDGASDPEALVACRQIALALQWFIGFGAATYILWLGELSARCQFLASRRGGEVGAGRDRPWQPSAALQPFLWLALFALAWRGLAAVVLDG